MILLDTCALLWLVKGSELLSLLARQQIEQAPVVYLSAISGFEIGIKFRKGKLKLPLKPEEWCQLAVRHHDLSVLPLDMDICLASTALPAIHQDPCDRFIIATAQHYHLPAYITHEKKISCYGWVNSRIKQLKKMPPSHTDDSTIA